MTKLLPLPESQSQPPNSSGRHYLSGSAVSEYPLRRSDYNRELEHETVKIK